MTKPVFNLTRACHLKRHQALLRIAAHTAAWVERDKSIRELTLAEVLELRMQIKRRGDLQDTPHLNVRNELPGLVWEPPLYDKYACWARRPLLVEAAKLLRGDE